MLVFPQLSTGTTAGYPLRRWQRRRTVQNVLEDGSTIRFGDSDFAVRVWEIDAIGLTQAEWQAIENLHQVACGRLNTFTFLEPAGNLLAESETFDAPQWENSALVDVTGGVNDPWGGTRASLAVNAGPTPGVVSQELAVPANFRFALSVWARSSSGAAVSLFGETAGGMTEGAFPLSAAWQRIVLPVALEVASESVRFGARLAPGAAIDLCGMQVDAQPGAGDYQRTGARGGVYSKARFATDELTVRARGTDVFDVAIRIESKGN